jgi:hypothetical protein
MKISNQDIVSAAQELRDEENQQLDVRPWNHHRHFRFPAWLAAIPAAAIIGFFFGVWTNSQTKPEQPLAALVDTVYVTVKETPNTPDTMQSVSTSAPTQSENRHVRCAKRCQQKQGNLIGQSILNDKIRYDLLVKN